MPVRDDSYEQGSHASWKIPNEFSKSWKSLYLTKSRNVMEKVMLVKHPLGMEKPVNKYYACSRKRQL